MNKIFIKIICLAEIVFVAQTHYQSRINAECRGHAVGEQWSEVVFLDQDGACLSTDCVQSCRYDWFTMRANISHSYTNFFTCQSCKV